MNSTSETDPTTPQDDWQTLRTTLILYLPAFCFVAVLFCFVRRRFPRVYNVRNSVDRLKCRLAVETYGSINWTWTLLQIPDNELVEQCGLDAVCLCRILRVGLKLALLGCFCALFLIPSYATAASGSTDSNQDDGVDENLWITTTTAHLPQGSRVFTATILAVYLLMGSTLYVIYKEFRWFTAIRAQTFLSKVCPRSYSVYVTGVPLQLRSDQALRDFFRRVLSNDAVVMASVPLHIPNLQHKIKQRQRLQNNLEHCRALQHNHGVPNPTLVPAMGLGECVPAIPYYQQQLIELNAQIKQVHTRIRTKQAATARASKTAVKASYELARQCQSSNESRHLELALSQRIKVKAGNHHPGDDNDASMKIESSSDCATDPPVARTSLSRTTMPQQGANNGDASALSSASTVSHCRSVLVGQHKISFSKDGESDTNEQEDSMASEPTIIELEQKGLRQGDSSGGTTTNNTATTTSEMTDIENGTAATNLSGTPTLLSTSILRLASSRSGGEGDVPSKTTITALTPALSGKPEREFSVSFCNKSEFGGLRDPIVSFGSVLEARSVRDEGGKVDDQVNEVEFQTVRRSGEPGQTDHFSQGQSTGILASRLMRRDSSDSFMACMDDDSLGDFNADRSRAMPFMGCLPYQARKEKLEEIFAKSISAIVIRSNDDDGMPLNAGFVTFSKLSAVSAALQVVHSSTPSQIIAEEAPDPDHIIWHNVGLSNNALQAGRLLSASITIALIIFWTVPVTAIVSLTEVKSLQEFFPFLEDWLEAAPWLEGVLNQLAPLTLSLLNNVILPMILMSVSRLDGVIDISFLESCLVVKLTAFHLVQTFLVASIASSVTEALSKVQTASDIFRYLAETLPPQAIFFIQLVLISTVIGIGAELLRTTALVQAGCRKFVGPRVTQDERDKPWMGLRPLSNPRFFLFAQTLAKINLFFMIFLTFAVLSPFICFVMAFAFLVSEIAARHQLIYIYPILDSGGKLWLHSIKILLICVVIAEGIVMSYMGIVRARAQFYMMIPLLVVTVLFEMYLFQRHFIVASHLSSEDCVAFDVRNDLNNSTAQALFGTPYVQPALRAAQNDELRTNEEEEEEGQRASAHSKE